jgi:hypothetical protein
MQKYKFSPQNVIEMEGRPTGSKSFEDICEKVVDRERDMSTKVTWPLLVRGIDQ